jgi:hypothetical protein
MRPELRLRTGLSPSPLTPPGHPPRWQAGSTAGHSVPEDRRDAAAARPGAVRTEHRATVCFSGVTDTYTIKGPAWLGGAQGALLWVAGCRRCRHGCRHVRPAHPRVGEPDSGQGHSHQGCFPTRLPSSVEAVGLTDLKGLAHPSTGPVKGGRRPSRATRRRSALDWSQASPLHHCLGR